MSLPKHIRYALGVFLFAIAVVPFSALAQSSSGSLAGNVTDNSGAALPGVTVTATNVETNASRTSVTMGSGYYEIPLLRPGTYRVSAELSGFQTVTSRANVTVGTSVTLDISMRAAVAETVTVTAAAPVVETTRSAVSSVVNDIAIENLPTNGRNFIDFVLTTPGVVKDVRLGDISFAGQRGTMNSLVVDGANNDNTFFGQTVGRTGSGRAPYQFSEDAVKEFQVNSGTYSAEYGRAGGAVINVVTKSGTNDLAGTVFAYYRDKSLNANNYINEINNRPKSAYHFDQYGFAVGGPIVRDKHFFFANFDAQRNATPNPVILGGGRIASFPGDGPTQGAIQQLLADAAEYEQQQNQNVYLLKTDHQLFSSSHLSLRYNRQRFNGVNYENSGLTIAESHSGDSNVYTDSLSGVFDMVPTTALFNEVRLQALKDREPGEANSAAPEAAIFQGGVAVISIGRNTFSPRETTIKRWQLADTATYLLNRHTLKGGFDYSKDDILNYFPGNFFGSYRFNSLADFYNKTAATYTQAFPGVGTTGPTTHPDLKETGLFVQDEWHPSAALTINAGLRYDKQAIAQPSVQNPDAQLLAAGYRTDEVPQDTDNFAPRFGLAWTPGQSGRTVVRGGYGVFYGRTPSIMIGTAHSNNGINVQTITFTGTQIPVYPNIYPGLPTGVVLPKPTIFVFNPDFENPEVHQMSFGAEQQIGSDFSVGASYQYVVAQDLPRSRDINVSTPTTVNATIAGGGPITFNRYTGRPFTNFTRVIAFESTAKSRYGGLTLDLQKRFNNNWQARIAWTHATVHDNKPDATAVVPFSSGDDGKHASDPLNLNSDYTYGDNDIRDRIVFNGVWALDSYAQKLTSGASKAIFGGWTLSGIISYQTGYPYSANVGADVNNDGNPSNDLAPGFRRNSLRLPALISVDPRIAKDIRIFGATHLSLIAEAFNVLNRKNISAVNRTKYSYNSTTQVFTPLATFGTPTATTGQRIVQLAAKVSF